MHAVFSYSEIRHKWDRYYPCPNSAHDIKCFADLFFLVLKGDKTNEVTKVICIAWGFWSRRNTLVYEGATVQPLEVFESSISMLTNFQNSLKKSEVLKSRALRWDPPSLDYLKLDVDGALFFNLQKAGIGCVVHDNNGKVLIAACLVVNNVNDPATIEALAIFRSF